MNADEKKLMRKFVTQEADKARARLEDKSVKAATDAEQPTAADRKTAEDGMAALALAAKEFNARMKALESAGFVPVDDDVRYPSSVSMVPKAMLLGLSSKEKQVRRIAAMKAFDRKRQAVEEKVRDTLLEIIAGDLPGVKTQMKKLQEELSKLVD